MLRTIDYTTDIRRPSSDAAHLLLTLTSNAVSRSKVSTPWLRRLTMLMIGCEPETYPGFEFAFWLVRRYNPWCADIHSEIEGAARYNDPDKARADLNDWLEYVKRTVQDVLEPQDREWLECLTTP